MSNMSWKEEHWVSVVENCPKYSKPTTEAEHLNILKKCIGCEKFKSCYPQSQCKG